MNLNYFRLVSRKISNINQQSDQIYEDVSGFESLRKTFKIIELSRILYIVEYREFI